MAGDCSACHVAIHDQHMSIALTSILFQVRLRQEPHNVRHEDSSSHDPWGLRNFWTDPSPADIRERGHQHHTE
jgi:hypothetical protein